MLRASTDGIILIGKDRWLRDLHAGSQLESQTSVAIGSQLEGKDWCPTRS